MKPRNYGNENTSAGAAWVDRFLVPRLRSRFVGNKRISCLQIAPDDDTEAQRLRELGHSCATTHSNELPALPFLDSSHDFIFTGRFTVLARERDARIAFAKELHRVLRPGGSLLLVLGNRRCVIDLTKNGALIHGPGSKCTLSFGESHEILVQKAEFNSLTPLNVSSHFGWNSIPVFARWMGGVLDAYWRFLATPERRWIYTSPLNPTFVLWLNKD
jgi:SAM-dependent methyltransferase